MKLSRICACGESTQARAFTNCVRFRIDRFLNSTADYENILSMQGMLALAMRGASTCSASMRRVRGAASLGARGLSRNPCMLTGYTESASRGSGVIFLIARFPNEHPNTRTIYECKRGWQFPGERRFCTNSACIFEILVPERSDYESLL
jgi:hypothetical protein